jgi:diguanylate cyclase (GGDEF)-like protein
MKKGEFSNLNKTALIDDDSDIKVSLRHPYLVVFIGNDSGKRHKLKPGTMTIGRSPRADIRLDDNRVSGIHCVIKWTDDVIAIEDKGSTNGTYVDSQKIGYAHLPPDVPFQIGHSVMKIEYKDEAEIRFEESLIHRASIDTLTGIFNRQHFMGLASKEIAYARRHQQVVGIIMIDIDNFKRVNDNYGHIIGDFILTQVSSVIGEGTRAEDLFGRYGGEEFIILPHGEIEKEAIFNQCERIRKAVEKFEFCHAEACVRLTISIGFHLDRPNNDAVKSILKDLIDKADKALYLAKEKGKNRVESLI